jgi:predicted alpha/beta hydrolase
MTIYARLCGGVLANAHARSGDRVAIASYLGGGEHFDRAMVEFAARYADQNERDHAALVAAAASGRIRVQAGA